MVDLINEVKFLNVVFYVISKVVLSIMIVKFYIVYEDEGYFVYVIVFWKYRYCWRFGWLYVDIFLLMVVISYVNIYVLW